MSGTISLALCCRLGEKGSIPLLTAGVLALLFGMWLSFMTMHGRKG